VLESLAASRLEDGAASAVVRGSTWAVYPTRFMLVASTNPCPCGFHPQRLVPLPARRTCCATAAASAARLLDRIDLLLAVGRPSGDELGSPAVMTSEQARRARGSRRVNASRPPTRWLGCDVQRP